MGDLSGSEEPRKTRRRRERRRSDEARGGAREGRRDGATAPANPLALVGRIGFEVVAIAGEMLAIPARLWMRAAEAVGAVVLAAARWAWPRLVAVWRLTRRLLAWAARVVTPLRATTAVSVVAAIALGASQFADYRTVEIGGEQYQSVQSVAPAPDLGTRDPRSAHGAWLLILAAGGLVAVGLAVRGRPRAALALVPIGLTAIAVAVLHDHDAGLEAGGLALAYQGATPVLLGGYSAEIAAGAVLAACGPLLFRDAQATASDPGARSRSRPRLRWPKRRGRARSRPARAAG